MSLSIWHLLSLYWLVGWMDKRALWNIKRGGRLDAFIGIRWQVSIYGLMGRGPYTFMLLSDVALGCGGPTDHHTGRLGGGL